LSISGSSFNPAYVPPSPVTAPQCHPPVFMDSLYIDSSTVDSRQPRSRANSHLSSTALQFQGLNILESDQASSTNEPLLPVGFRTTSPQSFIDEPNSSTTHISAPTPQGLTPFPLLSDSELDADWTYLEATGGQTGSTPFLTVDPSQSFQPQRSNSSHSLSPPTILRSNSIPANMR
jgi:hypothetical protein